MMRCASLLMLLTALWLQSKTALASDMHLKGKVTEAGVQLTVVSLDGTQAFRIKYISGDKGFKVGDYVKLLTTAPDESTLVKPLANPPLTARVEIKRVPVKKPPK
jgi:hypothetical protein